MSAFVAARLGAVNAAWERFWFAPVSTSTVAVVRIWFGLLMTAWTISLSPSLLDMFGEDGILPATPAGGDGIWTLLDLEGGDGAVIALFVVLLLASISLTAGYHSRLAAVLVFVGLISFERRNPLVFNGGDLLLRTTAFYLMLAPSGAALSIDRLRRARDRFWDFPQRAPWALRLIQIQLSIVYLSTVWDKVRGTTWNDGTAVSYALRLDDLERFPVPDFLPDTLLLVNLLTFGTLAIELSAGILIWNRALRPYIALLALSMHLGIEYRIRVGFFLGGLIASYLAFVPADRMDSVLLGVRDRLAARRRSITPSAAATERRGRRRPSGDRREATAP
jgi:hypothetical protein